MPWLAKIPSIFRQRSLLFLEIFGSGSFLDIKVVIWSSWSVSTLIPSKFCFSKYPISSSSSGNRSSSIYSKPNVIIAVIKFWFFVKSYSTSFPSGLSFDRVVMILRALIKIYLLIFVLSRQIYPKILMTLIENSSLVFKVFN